MRVYLIKPKSKNKCQRADQPQLVASITWSRSSSIIDFQDQSQLENIYV